MFSRRINLIALVLVALTLGIPAIAQEETRSEPRTITFMQNEFLGGQFGETNMPDSGDAIDISTATVEAGEPGASCTVSTLLHTVWFKIIHPGGTLDVNTAIATGTAFDSIVQLFRSDTAILSELTEIGCDDNSGGGSSANDARLVMPNLASAVYYGRISCIALCSGTTDLALSITYEPNEAAPENDPVDGAKPLQIGKAVKTTNAEHTTEAASEQSSLPGCDMYNTVWYTMTVPITGFYSFSTFGSFLNRPNNINTDTKIAVYRTSDGPLFANFTSLGCNDDFGNVGFGALPSISLNAGEEIYVRVGSFSARNLLNGSYYRLKTMVVSLSDVLGNSSFSSGLLTPWKMKITNSLDGVTNAYALTVFSARMVGEPGKSNSLKQSWSPSNFGILLPKNSTVNGSFFYSTNGTTSSKVKAALTVTYSNGAPSTSSTLKLPLGTSTGIFIQYHMFVPITQKSVASITLKITNKSPGGLVFIDDAFMRIFGDPGRDTKSPGGVLPPAVAPPGLRGLN